MKKFLILICCFFLTACPINWEKIDSETLTKKIQRGYDVKETDKSGRTPLMSAAAYANGDIVSLLIKNGADVNAQDSDGLTPLMYAARLNPDITVFKELIENGADVNKRNNTYESALLWAMKLNTQEVVKYLLNNKADINILTSDTRTPIGEALFSGNTSALLAVPPKTKINNCDTLLIKIYTKQKGYLDDINKWKSLQCLPYNNWYGMSIKSLIDKMGIPKQKYELDDDTYYVIYEDISSHYIPQTQYTNTTYYNNSRFNNYYGTPFATSSANTFYSGGYREITKEQFIYKIERGIVTNRTIEKKKNTF